MYMWSEASFGTTFRAIVSIYIYYFNVDINPSILYSAARLTRSGGDTFHVFRPARCMFVYFSSPRVTKNGGSVFGKTMYGRIIRRGKHAADVPKRAPGVSENRPRPAYEQTW